MYTQWKKIPKKQKMKENSLYTRIYTPFHGVIIDLRIMHDIFYEYSPKKVYINQAYNFSFLLG